MSGRRGVGFGLAALLPALGVTTSWLCCLPLAFGGLGAGAAALGTALAPGRPYLIGLSLLLLGLAFYVAYRPEKATCDADGSCAKAPSRHRQRTLLWIVAALSLALMTADRWASLAIFWML